MPVTKGLNSRADCGAGAVRAVALTAGGTVEVTDRREVAISVAGQPPLQLPPLTSAALAIAVAASVALGITIYSR
jgi:hypothetical protein